MYPNFCAINSSITPQHIIPCDNFRSWDSTVKYIYISDAEFIYANESYNDTAKYIYIVNLTSVNTHSHKLRSPVRDG
jgi:hypothetical protein